MCGAPSHRTPLARLLRRTLGEACEVDSLPALLAAPGLPVLAIHPDGLPEPERRALIEQVANTVDRPVVLVLSNPLTATELALLLASGALTNLVMLDASGVDAADLTTTIGKLRSGDIFGLDKYFRWGIEPRLSLIHASHQRADALRQVDAYACTLGLSSRLRALVRIVTDEFITNALYNAPVNSDGVRRYADRSRTLPVELPLRNAVELRFACDGERFGLSTTDPFGSLTADRVQVNLARGLRRGSDQVVEGTGGAGVGLYRILDSVSHFAINIEPGQRTELIGLLDIRGSYRNLASKGRSLNLFVAGAPR
jgi:anti-sigma regulatory factor (Ser/Thr protein kinase)